MGVQSTNVSGHQSLNIYSNLLQLCMIDLFSVKNPHGGGFIVLSKCNSRNSMRADVLHL